jgi:hypothetical protein
LVETYKDLWEVPFANSISIFEPTNPDHNLSHPTPF